MSAPTPAEALAASLARTDRLIAVIENDDAEAVRLLMAYELIQLSCNRPAPAARAATELALALMLRDAVCEVDLSDWN